MKNSSLKVNAGFCGSFFKNCVSVLLRKNVAYEVHFMDLYGVDLFGHR